jgi:hypothetical protein
MKRLSAAAAFLLASFVLPLSLSAAEPAVPAAPVPTPPLVAAPAHTQPIAVVPTPAATPARPASGRKRIEALLDEPATLDFGNRKRVPVKEVLAELHAKHQLSIRFDMPILVGLYESETAPAQCPATTPCLSAGCEQPGADSVCGLKPEPRHVAASPVAAAIKYAAAAATTAPQQAPTAAVPAGATPAPTIAKPAPAPKASVDTCPCCPADSHDQLPLDREIDVSTLDLRSVSVATVLRQALDVMSPAGQTEPGMPIALTNAGLLDYVVEKDDILITTRLKAMTYKETRVYSVDRLKGCKPEQLAATIRQAVRPWSWRSRIDEVREQLTAGGARLPPDVVNSIVKSGVQLASAESGLPDVTMTRVATEQPATNLPAAYPAANAYGSAPPPPPTSGYSAAPASEAAPAPKPAAKPSGELTDAEQAQMVGAALVNGAVTFLHSTLTALEIAHYADPPTGSIQVLPGKLIITQSQAAHREIADLLKQLEDE